MMDMRSDDLREGAAQVFLCIRKPRAQDELREGVPDNFICGYSRRLYTGIVDRRGSRGGQIGGSEGSRIGGGGDTKIVLVASSVVDLTLDCVFGAVIETSRMDSFVLRESRSSPASESESESESESRSKDMSTSTSASGVGSSVALENVRGGRGGYFRVDLPDGGMLVHLMKDGVPFSIQFGR